MSCVAPTFCPRMFMPQQTALFLPPGAISGPALDARKASIQREGIRRTPGREEHLRVSGGQPGTSAALHRRGRCARLPDGGLGHRCARRRWIRHRCRAAAVVLPGSRPREAEQAEPVDRGQYDARAQAPPASAFAGLIALPGGYGTLQEIIEVLCWSSGSTSAWIVKPVVSSPIKWEHFPALLFFDV